MMNSLEAVAAWQQWQSEHENYAGDVTAADADVTKYWFLDEHRDAALRHFQTFANAGDGSQIALWSRTGADFTNAEVVVLGHEGQVAYLARSVPEALAAIALAGSESFEATVAAGELGEPDAELTEFLRACFPSVSVPASFAVSARETGELRAALEALTGVDYESY